MLASLAMLALAILPRKITPTTALGYSIGANHPLTAAVLGITITIVRSEMLLRILTLKEAAPIVTAIMMTDTKPILFGKGAGQRSMKQPVVIFLMNAVHLSEGIPPVEGMNTRVRSQWIISSNRPAEEKRAKPLTGTVHSLGIFLMAHRYCHRPRWKS